MLPPTVVARELHERVTVTPERTITPDEEAVISSAGVKVLRHITQARSDIRDKDLEGAAAELDQAQKLLDIIQASVPTARIKDRIWVAKKHLEYADTQDVLPELIPIYTSLDEIVEVMPTESAKQHLDEARQHLESGDKGKASQALDATAGALRYTEVDLPLSNTRRLVSKAVEALKQGSATDADAALKTADESVVYLSVALQQPLFKARTLLWQTVRKLQAGDHEAAQADLKAAIAELEMAAKSRDKRTREAAEQILAQAGQLQQDLDGGSDISAGLQRLWQHTEALADRSVEHLSAGWARYRSENTVKSDLIDARLHLADARIDLFTGNEPAGAAEELRLAGQYLSKAAAAAKQQYPDGDVQKQIVEVRKALSELSSHPAASREPRYAALQQQLHDMISTL
jgi:hypothetical protein